MLEYRDDSTCNTLRVSLQLTNFTLECASLSELQVHAPRCGMIKHMVDHVATRAIVAGVRGAAQNTPQTPHSYNVIKSPN